MGGRGAVVGDVDGGWGVNTATEELPGRGVGCGVGGGGEGAVATGGLWTVEGTDGPDCGVGTAVGTRGGVEALPPGRGSGDGVGAAAGG